MTEEYERYAIPSSGDDAADRRELAAFAIRRQQLTDNLCPNDGSPLTILSEWDRRCPTCEFHHTRIPITVARDPG